MPSIQQRRKEIRDRLYQKQGGCCGLCHRHIEPQDAVLDHDHSTGRVRAVLHRGCNSLEGKMTNAIKRFTPELTTTQAMDCLQAYTYTQGTEYMPGHDFPEQREIRRLRKEIDNLLEQQEAGLRAVSPDTINRRKDKIQGLRRQIQYKYFSE